MIKREELSNPNSCMNRAKDDEMTFVLLGRDKAAPEAIRAWCRMRVDLGKNKYGDPQIQEAYNCAAKMEGLRESIAPPSISRETSAGQDWAAACSKCGEMCFGKNSFDASLAAASHCSADTEAAPLSGEGGERTQGRTATEKLYHLGYQAGYAAAVAAQGREDVPVIAKIILDKHFPHLAGHTVVSYDAARVRIEMVVEDVLRLTRVGGSPARSATFEQAVKELLDAMETCHICHAYLILQEYPIHCEDCSSDCENHDGGECTPIYILHEKVKKLLAALPGSLPKNSVEK